MHRLDRRHARPVACAGAAGRGGAARKRFDNNTTTPCVPFGAEDAQSREENKASTQPLSCPKLHGRRLRSQKKPQNARNSAQKPPKLESEKSEPPKKSKGLQSSLYAFGPRTLASWQAFRGKALQVSKHDVQPGRPDHLVCMPPGLGFRV